MLSAQKFLVPTAVGAALAVAACGSSSRPSSSTAAGSSTAAQPASSSGGVKTLTIATTHGSAGTYLTGASGRALYLWVADHNRRSSCSGACAQAWPPVTAGSVPHAGAGVSADDLSLIPRRGGGKQVAYYGHPLYYFAGDPSAGSTSGEGSNGFGAKWWLVAPAGRAITGAGSTGGSSTSSSSGGGSGYSAGGSGY